jgi:hypothetical protein
MGDARRRQLSTGQRFRKPAEPLPSLSRSPQQLIEEKEKSDRCYGMMAAAIDFINEVENDVERKQIRRALETETRRA